MRDRDRAAAGDGPLNGSPSRGRLRGAPVSPTRLGSPAHCFTFGKMTQVILDGRFRQAAVTASRCGGLVVALSKRAEDGAAAGNPSPALCF